MLSNIENWIKSQSINAKIILIQDILDYFDQPHYIVRQHLRSIKKDTFEESERIIFYATQEFDSSLLDYIWNVCLEIDIPDFFVTFYSTVELPTCKFRLEKLPFPITDRKFNQKTNFNFSNRLCPDLWISTEVNSSGKYAPCCKYQNSNKGDIINNSFLESHRSTYMQQRRKKVQQGIPIEECNICWKDESIGKTSKRQRAFFVYNKLLDEIDFNNVDSPKVQSLDIKLTRTCNLKCRICNHKLSSSWASEVLNNKESFSTLAVEQSNSNLWNPGKDDKFVSRIEEIGDQVRYITFSGGEPFLDKNLSAILDIFIKNETSKQIKLHFNTNGTQYPESLFGKLAQFSSVEISFSIDNIGEKFNYERHGSSWEIVNENLQKFSKNKIFTYDIFQTVSLFNALDVPKVMEYARSLNFGYEMSFLIWPKEFSLVNASNNAKKLIEEQLSTITNSKTDSIINFTKTTGNYNKEEFWKKIDIIDKIRNEDFRLVYPELAQAMQ